MDVFLIYYIYIYNFYWFLIDTVSSKIDPKCVVDDSKPAAAPDNYMDCNTTQARKSNRTSCCNIEDEIVCCDGETG